MHFSYYICTMEEKKKEIIKAALDVYMKFGIKSVTMDEMARQLGVSKKTLYIYVKDKNELVEECFLYGQGCDMEMMDNICKDGENAIEELLEIYRSIIKILGSIHPSIFFDLQKYHPNALKLVKNHKDETIRQRVVANMEKGMAEGVYRGNLTPDIVSRIHMATMDLIMSGELVPLTDYKMEEVFSEFFRYDVRGIASEKGLELLKELIRKDENL